MFGKSTQPMLNGIGHSVMYGADALRGAVDLVCFIVYILLQLAYFTSNREIDATSDGVPCLQATVNTPSCFFVLDPRQRQQLHTWG